MFKIIAVLTYLYLITSLAVTESNINQPKDTDGAIQVLKREERQAERCPGVQEVISSPQVSVPYINPESDLLKNKPSQKKPQKNEILDVNEKTYDTENRNPDSSVHQVKETKEDVELVAKSVHKLPNPVHDQVEPSVEDNNKDSLLEAGIKSGHWYKEPHVNQKTLESSKFGDRQNYNPYSNQLEVNYDLGDKQVKSGQEYEPYIAEKTNHKEANRPQSQVEENVGRNCGLLPNSRRANNEDNSPQTLPNIAENQNVNVPAKDENLLKKARYDGPQRRQSGFNNNQLADPARGSSVSLLSPSGVNLWEHNRVCYACTSANNPTCLQPDRRTTVKYCLKGHEACVTKTFQTGKDKGSLVLIRDCGISCDDTDIPGPQYKSCKVCNSDICNDDQILNGAFSTKSQCFIVFTSFIIFITKYAI